MTVPISSLPPGTRFRTTLTRTEGEVRLPVFDLSLGIPVTLHYPSGRSFKNLHPDVQVIPIEDDFSEAAV